MVEIGRGGRNPRKANVLWGLAVALVVGCLGYGAMAVSQFTERSFPEDTVVFHVLALGGNEQQERVSVDERFYVSASQGLVGHASPQADGSGLSEQRTAELTRRAGFMVVSGSFSDDQLTVISKVTATDATIYELYPNKTVVVNIVPQRATNLAKVRLEGFWSQQAVKL